MKTIIQTNHAPAPIGAYNQAVMFSGMLYVSGQIAIDPTTNKLVEGSIQDETEQVMGNLAAILTEAGMTFKNVLKTSIFISDMNNFAEINSVYSRYFDEKTAPARETVEVANLPKFVNVEISLVAAK